MIWSTFTPFTLLCLAIAASAFVVAYSEMSRRRRQRELAELARQWQMQYSTRDLFSLGSRIAQRLPVMGAAEVRVRDLIYGTDPGGAHRCIFSADYTAGVVRSKSRRRCVISVMDSRGGGCTGGAGGSADSGWTSFRIAAQDLPLIEQYRSLHEPTATRATTTTGDPA